MPVKAKFQLMVFSAVMLSASASATIGDELSELKKDIEALEASIEKQSVHQTETQAPQGNLIQIKRGDALADWKVDRARDIKIPAESGWTATIGPTGGFPATELSVSGYINARGSVGSGGPGIGDKSTSTAGEGRFRVRSRTQTSVGEIRMLYDSELYGKNQKHRPFWEE